MLPDGSAMVGWCYTPGESPTNTLALLDLPTLEERWRFVRDAGGEAGFLGGVLVTEDALLAVCGSM